jgi:gas vesicle protein
MWLTASVSAVSLGVVIWAVAAKLTAAKRGETLRETLRRQWRRGAEDAPDVTPEHLKEANRLTLADDLDSYGHNHADGGHADSGWDSGGH